MLHSKKDILSDIDETLDQLLVNAEILTEIAHEAQLEEERLALESLQESLLSHLVNMDTLLKEGQAKAKPPLIAAKLEKLDAIRSKKRRTSLIKR